MREQRAAAMCLGERRLPHVRHLGPSDDDQGDDGAKWMSTSSVGGEQRRCRRRVQGQRGALARRCRRVHSHSQAAIAASMRAPGAGCRRMPVGVQPAQPFRGSPAPKRAVMNSNASSCMRRSSSARAGARPPPARQPPTPPPPCRGTSAPRPSMAAASARATRGRRAPRRRGRRWVAAAVPLVAASATPELELQPSSVGLRRGLVERAPQVGDRAVGRARCIAARPASHSSSAAHRPPCGRACSSCAATCSAGAAPSRSIAAARACSSSRSAGSRSW